MTGKRTCEVCGREYDTIKYLTDHGKIVEQGICEHCGTYDDSEDGYGGDLHIPGHEEYPYKELKEKRKLDN